MRGHIARRLSRYVLPILVVLTVPACHQLEDVEPAELVLLGGRIVTVEADHPEVEALAAADGRIVALGREEELRRYIGPATEVIHLEGALAVPGFIDSHAHFLGIAEAKLQLDLTGARSWAEIVDMVATAAHEADPGEWILGRGWHQEKWQQPPTPSVDGMPVHQSLSRAAPENPVLLGHASGHAVFANAKALEVAGITRDTPDPEGGEIIHDARGEPTGALLETAEGLVEQARAEGWNEAATRRKVRIASEECLAKGITSLQDAGSSFLEIDLLKAMADEAALDLRLWVMISADNEELSQKLPEYRLLNVGDGFLTVRAIKQYIDGALGSHGAWLLEPYSDLPESRGFNVTDLEELTTTAELALENGFQLCTHAIGDRANRETLDLYARTLGEEPDPKTLRWRIEHAQHLHPDDIPWFSKLGVIAAMQAVHCTSDGPWVPERLGDERARAGAYVWRRLLDSGAVIANGTDAPVEDVSPIASFYSAVTRRMADGTVFHPEQRMTREEALRSYTLDAAYAAFEEDEKGSLAVGKLADITVLSQNILTIPEEEILDTEVLYTIVGGAVKHRRDGQVRPGTEPGS